MKTNREIADIFDEIGFLLELKGENIFKVRAYYNAALIIKKYPVGISRIKDLSELKKIKGIGEAISKKIMEILESGDCALHKKLLNEFPRFVFELRNIKGIGPKIIKKIFFDKNIKNASALKKALSSGELSKMIANNKLELIKEYLGKTDNGK